MNFSLADSLLSTFILASRYCGGRGTGFVQCRNFQCPSSSAVVTAGWLAGWLLGEVGCMNALDGGGELLCNSRTKNHQRWWWSMDGMQVRVSILAIPGRVSTEQSVDE